MKQGSFKPVIWLQNAFPCVCFDETVVFGLEDSGEADATVTYAAYPGETPVFSSGKQIRGWNKVAGKLPGLPEKAQGKVLEAKVTGQFHRSPPFPMD